MVDQHFHKVEALQYTGGNFIKKLMLHLSVGALKILMYSQETLLGGWYFSVNLRV